MPVNVAEAAIRLDMKRQSIRRAIQRGTLRATEVRKDGREHWTIDEDEIERYRRDHWRPGHRKVDDEPSDEEVFAMMTSAARIEGRVE